MNHSLVLLDLNSDLLMSLSCALLTWAWFVISSHELDLWLSYMSVNCDFLTWAWIVISWTWIVICSHELELRFAHMSLICDFLTWVDQLHWFSPQHLAAPASVSLSLPIKEKVKIGSEKLFFVRFSQYHPAYYQYVCLCWHATAGSIWPYQSPDGPSSGGVYAFLYLSLDIRVSQKNTFFELCFHGWTTGAK